MGIMEKINGYQLILTVVLVWILFFATGYASVKYTDKNAIEAGFNETKAKLNATELNLSNTGINATDFEYTQATIYLGTFYAVNWAFYFSIAMAGLALLGFVHELIKWGRRN